MTNKLMEIWKPLDTIDELKGFKHYEVSTLGRIKSYHHDKDLGRVLKLSKRTGNGCTYLAISLNDSITGKRRKFSAHRLVMLVFNYTSNHANLTVDHINGDTFDNRLQNLQWMTAAENIRKSQCGSRTFDNPAAIASEYLESGAKLSDMAKKYGCSVETMWRTINVYAPQQNTKKRRVFDKPLRRQIAESYLEGRTLQDVANEYNCATSTVSKVVQEYRRGELNELS